VREYGYVRVSTKKQNIERQIRNIKKEHPNALIVQDEYTGTSLARPSWERLMKTVRNGDTIVFDSVSRMSRNAEEGFAVYEVLFNKNIELIFLREPQINTGTYKNALQKTVPMIRSCDRIP
jgi:DNA invertase Pin-like site-specific DNA recombinase